MKQKLEKAFKDYNKVETKLQVAVSNLDSLTDLYQTSENNLIIYQEKLMKSRDSLQEKQKEIKDLTTQL